jgi:hypothetical protein
MKKTPDQSGEESFTINHHQENRINEASPIPVESPTITPINRPSNDSFVNPTTHLPSVDKQSELERASQ